MSHPESDSRATLIGDRPRLERREGRRLPVALL